MGIDSASPCGLWIVEDNTLEQLESSDRHTEGAVYHFSQGTLDESARSVEGCLAVSGPSSTDQPGDASVLPGIVRSVDFESEAPSELVTTEFVPMATLVPNGSFVLSSPPTTTSVPIPTTSLTSASDHEIGTLSGTLTLEDGSLESHVQGTFHEGRVEFISTDLSLNLIGEVRIELQTTERDNLDHEILLHSDRMVLESSWTNESSENIPLWAVLDVEVTLHITAELDASTTLDITIQPDSMGIWRAVYSDGAWTNESTGTLDGSTRIDDWRSDEVALDLSIDTHARLRFYDLAELSLTDSTIWSAESIDDQQCSMQSNMIRSFDFDGFEWFDPTVSTVGTFELEVDTDAPSTDICATEDDADDDGYTESEGDCDDTNAQINPDGQEVCDLVEADEDCDGLVNEADPSLDRSTLTEWFEDNDNDGYGQDASSVLACAPPTGFVALPGDCNDTDPAIHPDAQEVCDSDDTDEDCDGLADDADPSLDTRTHLTWHPDSDGDSFGDPDSSLLSCDPLPGYVGDNTDCDDTRADINPAGQEVCDSATDDEDCDGFIDDLDPSVDPTTESTWYLDNDADGYGNPHITTSACDAPTGYVGDNTDCDDATAAVNPAATEICDSSDRDDNCDGLADDNDPMVDTTTYLPWYEDADGDGYGNALSTQSQCNQPPGYVSDDSDCVDTDSTINPGAVEVCDADDVDEDCNGLTDDSDTGVSASSKTTHYQDADGDLFGNPSATQSRCDPGGGYIADSTDCDDTDSNIKPSATEVCDGVDNDCDTLSDDNDPSLDVSTTTSWYRDADADGYGDASTSAAACSVPSGYVADHTDCDDSASWINPSGSEVCDAANTDEDCDGLADDADSSVVPSTRDTWFLDADGDGYGTTTTTTLACDLPSGYAASSTDCNDSDSTIHPDAVEVCDAADADEDCNGLADDLDPSVSASSLLTWHPDTDGDGYGDENSTSLSCDSSSGLVADGTDCDDTDALIHPGATEECDPFDVDENCNGVADDLDGTTATTGMTTYSVDADGDGYGHTTSTDLACDLSSGLSTDNSDCDDSAANVNPGATEDCDDTLDDDCDGYTDCDDTDCYGTVVCCEDSFEPNNACNVAASITTGTHTNLVSGAEDFYTISVPNGQTIAVSVTSHLTSTTFYLYLYSSESVCSTGPATDYDESKSSTSVSWTNTSGSSADVVVYAAYSSKGCAYTYDMAVSVN